MFFVAPFSMRVRQRGWGGLILMLFFAGAAGATFGQAAPGSRFAVVLDAAHGGEDSGATLRLPSGKIEAEKAYTLDLSVRLRSLLTARGISVITTRESDTGVDAQRRAEIANHADAQACLTLHATMTGSGVHLFLSSLAPQEPGRLTPWKTAQAGFVLRSTALAGALNSALLHAGMKVTIGRTALTTIDSMACPAIAVEIAPPGPSGDSSGGGIDDPNYEARIADALTAAVVEWRTEGSNGGMGGQQP